MYKVLLVDDEKYISRGLEMGVDWKSINVNTIYTAQNGVQALSLIHKKKAGCGCYRYKNAGHERSGTYSGCKGSIS